MEPESPKIHDERPPGHPAGREKLSVVVVAKDEARQIAGCLRALRFADEIVVVDTGSRDGTPEIARGLARVEAFEAPHGGPEVPLIHAAKNFGFERAAGPWILSVDADERLSDGLRDEVLAVLARPEPDAVAYALPFIHCFFGRYLKHGGFRGPIVRLFRKGRVRYPEDRAHSTPVVDGRVGSLRSPVIHFNHPRIADFVRKMDLYTSQDAFLSALHGHGGLRDRPAVLPGRWRLFRDPLGVFWNRFVRHAGFLDGPHGLVACTLLAAYRFVELAKLWEAMTAASTPGAFDDAVREAETVR
jgi:glycosyltransferase involved in cell wall biosynthesis